MEQSGPIDSVNASPTFLAHLNVHQPPDSSLAPSSFATDLVQGPSTPGGQVAPVSDVGLGSAWEGGFELKGENKATSRASWPPSRPQPRFLEASELFEPAQPSLADADLSNAGSAATRPTSPCYAAVDGAGQELRLWSLQAGLPTASTEDEVGLGLGHGHDPQGMPARRQSTVLVQSMGDDWAAEVPVARRRTRRSSATQLQSSYDE